MRDGYIRKGKNGKLFTDKEKYVYNILLLPIDTITRNKKQPYIKNNRIQTGEIYIPAGSKMNGALDADMSDIAIKFYETIYSTNILAVDRKPINRNFMGDTMISIYKNEINNYHCLANFWVLPEDIGRNLKSEFSRGRATGLADRVDSFLADLKNRKDKYKEAFPDYFEKMGFDEIFYEKHYLINSFVDETNMIIRIYSVDKAKEAICNRAAFIAKERGEELYNLFQNLLKRNEDYNIM